MIRRRFQARRLVRGVAMIELALMTLPIVLLLLVSVEFSRAVLVYNLMVRNVRDGARHLSMVSVAQADDPLLTLDQEARFIALRQEAMCLAFNGTLDCAGDPVVPGLTTAMVEACDWQRDAAGVAICADHQAVDIGVAGKSIDLVSVSIQGYQYPSAYLGSLIGVVVPFKDVRAVMRARP